MLLFSLRLHCVRASGGRCCTLDKEVPRARWFNAEVACLGAPSSEAAGLETFFPLTTLLAGFGTIGLTVASIPEARRFVQGWMPPIIWVLCRDYTLWVVVFLALLTVVPPMIDRGRRSILTAATLRNTNIELTTAVISLRGRLMHLITKISDVAQGNQDGTFIQHTLLECCNYFKQRSIETDSASSGSAVDAMLFELKLKQGRPERLERKKFTHDTAEESNPRISRRRGTDAAELLDGLTIRRDPIATATPDQRASLLSAMGCSESKYRDFLIVPVVRDRKAPGAEGVYGALMIMAEHPGALRQSDHTLLSTFAGVFSLALAADRVIPRVRSESQDLEQEAQLA